MAITSNCAEIIITNPQGPVSFNKLITTTELSPAKTIYSEDRVYLIQNSGNAPQTFWWNLEKAIADGYADLQELYDYFVAEIANQCGGGGGGGIESIVAGDNITIDDTDPENPIVTASFTQQGKYLISGGISWSGTGLVYDVSTLEYFFNGNKTSTATQVTLGASDPSNNRFDVVVVNEAGVVSVIQGTASSSPEIPPIPETELMVSAILVEAGSVSPTILSEAIYLDDPTTDWTFSTYTTGSPTGTIIFNGTTTPKQGIHCIEANADQRLGARFVRSTSFDAYQYSMFSVWVRFTSAVAPNNALNVRFENSGGSLVGNTVNLFNFGLQRNIINTWQLVVIPLTSFGSLPSTVKGFRTIMTGGTIGVPRQWDIDYMHLTNGSIPYANVPTIAFQKDGVGVGSASTLNIKEGTNMTITPSVNPISGAVEYEFEAGGGGAISALTPATATNTIDNGNFQQNWNWNTLGGGIGLKLASSATTSYVGTQSILEIRKTGVTSGGGFNHTLLNVVNEDSNLGSLHKAAHFEAVHYAITTGKVGGGASYGDIGIQGNSAIRWLNGNYDGAYIVSLPNGPTLQLAAPPNGTLVFQAGTGTRIDFTRSDGTHYLGTYYTGTTRQVMLLNARGSGNSYYAAGTHASVIENNSGTLKLSANTGLTANSLFTPTWQLNIVGSTNNVGIGTETPDASAKLDVTSTTQGFAPPQMTATQASAITTTSRRIIIYVTDTNGTFTSAGLWFWNGTIWKLIIAE